MQLSDFTIGLEFKCSGNRYRCTDVGSRVVVAIRIEPVIIAWVKDGHRGQRKLTYEKAIMEGCFRGPPYTELEQVFDEYDLKGCSFYP